MADRSRSVGCLFILEIDLPGKIDKLYVDFKRQHE